jgi:hypothetical protein
VRGVPARARAAGAGAATLAAVVVVSLAAATAIALGAANPAANIPLGALPAACERAPVGARCENASIRALDAARAKLGLGPYLLGRGFVSLAPARQYLILANLDRVAYSLPPIAGLSGALDTVAEQGATARADPNPWPLLLALHNQRMLGFASNWAGGQPNALLAYYGWMYDDGYRSGNLDCPSPSAAGCWGHRQDILHAFPKGAKLSMGAAVVRRARSYALTIVETSTVPWRYVYTWAQAKANGAGTRSASRRRGR